VDDSFFLNLNLLSVLSLIILNLVLIQFVHLHLLFILSCQTFSAAEISWAIKRLKPFKCVALGGVPSFKGSSVSDI
jgi:hypothetical protein